MVETKFVGFNPDADRFTELNSNKEEQEKVQKNPPLGELIQYAQFMYEQKFAELKNNPNNPTARQSEETYKYTQNLLEVCQKQKLNITQALEKLTSLADGDVKSNIGKTVEFIERTLDRTRTGNFQEKPRFIRWKNEKASEQASRETAQSERIKTKNRSADQKQMTEIRNNLEKELQKELIDEVIEKGASVLYTSFSSTDYSKNVGLNEVTSTKFSPGKERLAVKKLDDFISLPGSNHYQSPFFGKHVDDILRGDDIKEAVSMTRFGNKEIIVERSVEKPGGLFGLGKKLEKVFEQKEGEAFKCSEIIQGGNDEIAYQISYRFNSPDSLKDKYRYVDYSNRNIPLGFTITLPESVAKRVFGQIKKDPLFVRELVKQSIIKNVGISERTWEEGEKNGGHALKPPYREMKEQYGKTKMLIFDSDAKDFSIEKNTVEV